MRIALITAGLHDLRPPRGPAQLPNTCGTTDHQEGNKSRGYSNQHITAHLNMPFIPEILLTEIHFFLPEHEQGGSA